MPISAGNSPDRAVPARRIQIVNKAVAGGINEQSIVGDSLEEVAAEARDAIASMDGRHVLVTPGCVIRYATPVDRIRAVADAVRAGTS